MTKREGPPTLPAGCEAVRHDSGLETIEIEAGTGAAAEDGNRVRLQQRVWLLEGTLIEDTYRSGKPTRFRIGRDEVIAALDEGVLGLKVGGKRRLIVPSDLAHGPGGQGEVPPYATLIVDVELLALD